MRRGSHVRLTARHPAAVTTATAAVYSPFELLAGSWPLLWYALLGVSAWIAVGYCVRRSPIGGEVVLSTDGATVVAVERTRVAARVEVDGRVLWAWRWRYGRIQRAVEHLSGVGSS